ncbi:MAG TPA: porin family protein [Gemmatimonadaceae bacterium]|nr:porin family protein [Gemmatimonadaceae bacterium]
MARSRFLALAAATALAALPAPAVAQLNWHPAVGVLAGWNSSTVQGTGISSIKARSGFMAGAMLDAYPRARFSVQAEVQYTQKGAKGIRSDTAAIVPTPLNADVRVDYVEVPVLLRLNGNKLGGLVTPHLLAGPYLAFKAGCSVSGGSSSVPTPVACTDFGDFRYNDYGGIAGVGADFRMGRTTFITGVRYEWGGRDVVDRTTQKNRVLNVLAGFRW